MSIKKTILTVLIGLTLVGFFPSPSKAAFGWYNVTVKQIGPAANGEIYVMLSDNGGSFTNKWFVCLTAESNRQLAVILTAMTNSLPLQVFTDPVNGDIAGRIVVNLYMYAPE
jgi:hypothetical protein